ncbi:MAG: sigma-70 family RNA polymerase sigma factor [Gemmatimonadota bacterium]
MTDLDQQFETIYTDEADALSGTATRASAGDRDLAADIAQETWLRALLSWPRTGVPERPGAWLRTVSRNIMLNQHRRRALVRLDDVDPRAVPTIDPDDVLDRAEARLVVHAALEQLGPDERGLVQSFYFSGDQTASIAQRLGVSHRAVEGRLRRVRTRLRTILESDGISAADVRGSNVSFGVPLSPLAKAISMAALLPLLVAIPFYFVGQFFWERRSPRKRAFYQAASGIGLIALATFGSGNGRPLPLQLFGLGMLLWGSWRFWQLSVAPAHGSA